MDGKSVTRVLAIVPNSNNLLAKLLFKCDITIIDMCVSECTRMCV